MSHIGEVLGNLEKGRCVEATGNGLSLLDFLAQYHTVDGTGDGGVTQVGLGAFYVIALCIYCLLSLNIRKAGLLVVVGADEALVVEVLETLVISFLVCQ